MTRLGSCSEAAEKQSYLEGGKEKISIGEGSRGNFCTTCTTALVRTGEKGENRDGRDSEEIVSMHAGSIRDTELHLLSQIKAHSSHELR